MFSDILKRCQEDKKLIGVYTNRQDLSKFDVGIALAVDDDFLILSSVSKYGKRNGLLLVEQDSVVRVDEDSVYLRKIGALMRYYSEKPEVLSAEQYLVYSLLEYCHANNRIAAIDLLDSGTYDTVGFIDELDTDRCVIKQVSEFGKYDGTSSILLADITSISCCSEMEVMLEVLSSEMFDEVRFS